MGCVLMENGKGLLVDFVVGSAAGRAEREASQSAVVRGVAALA